MKNTILTLVMAAFLLPSSVAFAQHPKREHKPPKPRPEITEMVKDLSSSQKSRLDAISKESKERLERLHAMHDAVRDSVTTLIDLEGDHSKKLYPLFDREAALQAEISREMYNTKLRFDEVLTPEQRAELKAKQKRPQPRRKK